VWSCVSDLQVSFRRRNAAPGSAVDEPTGTRAWVHGWGAAAADRQRQPTTELNCRLRVAFIAGAEEHSRREVGRGLSDEELERVLRRYPGDLPER